MRTREFVKMVADLSTLGARIHESAKAMDAGVGVVNPEFLTKIADDLGAMSGRLLQLIPDEEELILEEIKE